MKFCSLLLSMAMVTSFIAPSFAADTMPYVDVSYCEVPSALTNQEAWNKSGQFCFIADGVTNRYPITELKKVVLRRKGEWVKSEYLKALSPEALAIVGSYWQYSLRYLALEKVVPGANQKFAAQVEYDWSGFVHTTLVLGEINPVGQARLTGFSDADRWTGNIRSGFKNARNVLLLNWKNPNVAATTETKSEDRERAKPVVDVVERYKAQAPAVPQP